MFRDKSDYSYETYNTDITHCNSVQSLFKGCLFRDIRITEVNFEKSDFEGARFEKNSIERVSFANADIRSAVFNATRFVECSFDSSYIDGCVFENCEFHDCTFHRALVTNNTFSSCTHQKTYIRSSTHALNKYYSSAFFNMSLGDCTFNHQLFSKCEFSGVSINIDALGSLYGLSEKNLADFDFIFLGDNLGKPIYDIISIANEFFKRKKWMLQLHTFHLNLDSYPKYDVLNAIFDTIFDCYMTSSYIIKDDIIFIKEIIRVLFAEKALPLFSVIYGISRIRALNASVLLESSSVYQKMLQDAIISLYNELSITLDNMITDYAEASRSLIDMDQKAVFSLHCSEKLSTKTDRVINALIDEYGSPEWIRAAFIQYEIGSVFEVIGTCVGGVFLFQLFLYGINGCLIQLTEMKGRIGKLMQKNLPIAYAQMVKEPKQLPPKEAIGILNLIADKKLPEFILSLFGQYTGKVIETGSNTKEVSDT